MTAKMFEKRYEQIKTEGNKYAEKIEGTLEEDLKKVIVEVMVRSEQLKAQIKLLEEKGISH